MRSVSSNINTESEGSQSAFIGAVYDQYHTKFSVLEIEALCPVPFYDMI